jgi:sporulation protein YlmC with PRC-barrel domain
MSSSHHLIAASRVKKTPVFDTSGERLGAIDDILIDKESGQSAYALMAFDGFFGLGERYYPLPWSMLHFDVERDGYVVPLNMQQIESGVSVDDEEVADEVRWREALHAYYGAPPYWSRSGG